MYTDESISILTTQNVVIEYPLASLSDRYSGAIIDNIIIFTTVIATALLLSALDINYDDRGWIFFAFAVIPASLYTLLAEILMDGQTIGKSIMQLKVVRLDGSRVGVVHYLIRWIFRLLDISLTLGGAAVLSIIIGGKGQRIGDIAAGTTVVSAKQENQTFNPNWLANFTKPQNHQITYPQVHLLTDEDINKIRTVYDAAMKHTNYKLLDELAERLVELLKIDNPIQPASSFIETILQDAYALDA